MGRTWRPTRYSNALNNSAATVGCSAATWSFLPGSVDDVVELDCCTNRHRLRCGRRTFCTWPLGGRIVALNPIRPGWRPLCSIVRMEETPRSAGPLGRGIGKSRAIKSRPSSCNVVGDRSRRLTLASVGFYSRSDGLNVSMSCPARNCQAQLQIMNKTGNAGTAFVMHGNPGFLSARYPVMSCLDSSKQRARLNFY